MFVDWFTVIAQIVNFIILIWLLKRFLYEPILQAVDDREKKISSRLADAELKISEAQIEKDEFNRKNEDIELRRQELLKKAESESEAEKQRLLNEIRSEAEAMRVKLNEELKKEKDELKNEIVRRINEEVFATAKKALSDLAGRGLNEYIFIEFIRQFRDMDAGCKNSIIGSGCENSMPRAFINSAFELDAKCRAEIQNAADELFGAGKVELQFKLIPDLVCGIEFTAGGYKLAWNISDYTAMLGKDVGLFLENNLNLKQGMD